MVIPTAASSILSPKSWTIPAYMALLAQDIAPIIANALKPRKLLLRTLPTNKPRATAKITLVKIIVPPRLIAAPVDRNEMEPPITKRKAPTSAPDPCANGVVKPPIFSHEGKRELIHAPINMGIIMFPPGIENFFFAFLVELMKPVPSLTIHHDAAIAVTNFSSDKAGRVTTKEENHLCDFYWLRCTTERDHANDFSILIRVFC